MREKERRNKAGKFLTKWMPIFLMVCIFLGSVLGATLTYIFQGEFPYEVIVGALVATGILTIIHLSKQKRKKNQVPEADERVIRNIFHFFAYSSHISLAVLFIGIAVFTLLGNESISIFYLWIFFFAYIWTVGIGAIITKSR